MNGEAVSHKTFRNERGELCHAPLSRAEADEILRQVEAEDARRKELMPDEEAARRMFFDAWLRLKDFGWCEAVYCPKDGSTFQVIEPGCSAAHNCHYEGEWPTGSWWVHCDDGDMGPSRPALFRPLAANA